jgi:alpha-1,3-rhamnosyl/mannosyltransferase
MRVLLNGLAALKPKTGVGHHVAQLHAHLQSHTPADQFTLYPGDRVGGWVKRFNKPKPTGGGKKPARPGFAAKLRESAKEVAKLASAVHFEAYSRSFPFDLYHEPNFVPYRSHLPTVVTVHDLSVVRFPQWHPTDRVRFHDRHFRRGLERADHVIVVSEAVRQETIELLGIPPNRVTAVHNGVNPGIRPQSADAIAGVRARHNLPTSYFLCVGTIEPRKNLAAVMRAFVDLPASIREMCPLVLAGPWGWKSEADREYFDTVAAPAGACHLGYVPDADLPALYAGATALLYPSHYEGFGFPPVEMLAVGGTVLASTDPAVREVVGSHARLLPPDDVAGWRDAMREVAANPIVSASTKANRIAHARTFSWDRAARETMAVYRQVLGLAPVQTASRAAA